MRDLVRALNGERPSWLSRKMPRGSGRERRLSADRNHKVDNLRAQGAVLQE